jgi:hypothetical protein
MPQAHASEAWIEVPEGGGLGDDRPVDHGKQIGGERDVGFEAEKHIPAAGPGRLGVLLHGVRGGGASEPDLAVAETGDRRHAAIDRPTPAAAKRHLDLNEAGGTYLDFVHAKRVTLKQATNHLSSCHRLGLSAAVGDGLFGQRLDATLHAGKLGRLAHSQALQISSTEF